MTDRTVHLSKNNPYVALSTSDPDEQARQSINGTTTVVSEEYNINIPTDYLEKAIQIERYTCGMRFICLVDLFINLYYMVYGYLFAVVFTFASLFGYMSTIYHKRQLLCCYLIYQYIQSSLKLLNCIVVLYVTSIDSGTNSTRGNETVVIIEKDDYVLTILLSILITFCQCYVMYFVQRYYSLLPTEEEQRRLLRVSL